MKNLSIKLLLIFISFQLSANNGCFSNGDIFELDLDKSINQEYKGCEKGSYHLTIKNIDPNERYIISKTKTLLSNDPLTKVADVSSPLTAKNLRGIRPAKSSEDISFNMDFNENVKIVVSKLDNNDDVVATWLFDITTSAKGKWLASWSLAILQNKSERYFTSENDDGSYSIMKKPDNNDLSIVPAVFYTYGINSKRNRDIQYGPTLGLGLDESNLTPFVGWNITYNENIGMSIGGVVHKRDVLLGEYNLNDPISENITTLTESVYKANFFIALSYQF